MVCSNAWQVQIVMLTIRAMAEVVPWTQLVAPDSLGQSFAEPLRKLSRPRPCWTSVLGWLI